LPDSLRIALHERGITGLVVDNHGAKLDGGKFATDLDNFMASGERGDPAERLMSEGRITDELLPGYDDMRSLIRGLAAGKAREHPPKPDPGS
jgi:hypothetical protein